MKLLIVLSAVVAVSMAGYLPGGLAGLGYSGVAGINPSVYAASHVYTAPHVYAAPVAISRIHHSQDALGQYNYGYTDGLSAKSEVRTADGVTRGGYTYIDANGQLQSVSYSADAANGFRVAASNLPQAPAAPAAQAPEPVQDTAEVSAARSAHLTAVIYARGAAAQAQGPQPVQETPEVASARAAHAAAHAAASARAAVVPSAYYGYGSPSVISLGPAGGFAYSSVAAAPLYSGYKYAAPAAPVVLTPQGVPVDTPEVQAARAADTIAHIKAKANLLG